ncbi:MAG TPA: hypothetical protein VII49_02255 [Rhizomicrobium sp.]
MTGSRFIVWGGLAALVLSARAEAQQPYPLQEMNFDMWCQEEKQLPPDRCDRRLPADDAEFQTYQATIEKYEIPFLQKKQQQENLNRVIIHGDPVDHPAQPSAPQNPGGTTPAGGTSTSQQ